MLTHLGLRVQIYSTPPHRGGLSSPGVSVSHQPNEDLVRRLKSIEGHVRGVQRMVEEGEYCIDVVNQISAIQSALKKVSAIMLDGHLRSCVTEAVRSADAETREEVLGELMQVFESSTQV